MARRRSLGAKIFLGLDQPDAEVAHPDAVDGDARRQRVVGRDEPAREVEAVARAVARRQRRGDGGKHVRGEYPALLVGPGEVAARQQVVLARLLGVTHDHELGDLGFRHHRWRFFFAGDSLDLEHFALRDFDGGTGVISVLAVVEKPQQAVVVLVRDGIEFVCVTLRATDGEPEPHGAGGVDAVHRRLDAKLLRVGTALLVDQRVAVEGAGDELRLLRVGQEVAGDLLGGEPVERQVVVERLDHPIAVRPHLPFAVDRITVRVRVARTVEPVPPPALAVVVASEQPVDALFVGLRTRVRNEGGDLLGRRQQAGQVEVGAADERRAIGARRRLDAFAGEAPAHQSVDRVRVWILPDSGVFHRLECPVALVFGSLGDPAPHQRRLALAEAWFLRFRWRHALIGVAAEHAREQLAVIGLAGDDRRVAAEIGERTLAGIEPQLGLALFRIGAVAEKTAIGKDRTDVAIELDAVLGQQV